MRKNKKYIIIGIISLLVGVSVFIGRNIDFNNKDITNNKTEITSPNEQGSNKANSDTINFLSSISGLKATNVELTREPVGFKGEVFAPTQTILNGVDYFLDNTNNDKMNNAKVNIGDKFISIYVDYKITGNISTPIEVKVIPSLDSNKNLVLNIEEVKLLDLKVANWIVNIALDKFIEDWFPKDEGLDIQFNKGHVIVNKNNFDGIYLEDIGVESIGLKLNLSVNLEKFMN